ncbi:hypothetical protein, partial [Pectinatus frisingensis]|uniref:hypothetical protein n=1 Tax=Pectinatus frisingensis TaxID=865 RepID=UPI0018C48696
IIPESGEAGKALKELYDVEKTAENIGHVIDVTAESSKAGNAIAHETNNFVKLNRVDDVIGETLEGASKNAGNITSKFGVTVDEALVLVDKLLEQGYKEVGKAGSGVFEKQVGNQTYRFRIDNSSLAGNHASNVPHVYVEILDEARNILVNNHIPLVE